jgi:hypothetical protein
MGIHYSDVALGWTDSTATVIGWTVIIAMFAVAWTVSKATVVAWTVIIANLLWDGQSVQLLLWPGLSL